MSLALSFVAQNVIVARRTIAKPSQLPRRLSAFPRNPDHHPTRKDP